MNSFKNWIFSKCVMPETKKGGKPKGRRQFEGESSKLE